MLCYFFSRNQRAEESSNCSMCYVSQICLVFIFFKLFVPCTLAHLCNPQGPSSNLTAWPHLKHFRCSLSESHQNTSGSFHTAANAQGSRSQVSSCMALAELQGTPVCCNFCACGHAGKNLSPKLIPEALCPALEGPMESELHRHRSHGHIQVASDATELRHDCEHGYHRAQLYAVLHVLFLNMQISPSWHMWLLILYITYSFGKFWGEQQWFFLLPSSLKPLKVTCLNFSLKGILGLKCFLGPWP